LENLPGRGFGGAKEVIKMTKKLVTHLWFDDKAEEAVKFYKKVFGPELKIGITTKYLTKTPSKKPIGSVMTAEFELFGQRFVILNGGPFFKLSEAVSFLIECKDQKEIDKYWKALSFDPKSEVCGWLKDKYGVSWQIVPKSFDKMMAGKDKKAATRVMEAVMKMKKIVIEDLEKAYKGGE
jgi:predicted 3-demethylubiquinone-9 3-methyltransferase (glyoxalase superfamily)